MGGGGGWSSGRAPRSADEGFYPLVNERALDEVPGAVPLIDSGAVDVDSLIIGRLRLHEVEDALLKATTDPLAVMMMVIRGLAAANRGGGREGRYVAARPAPFGSSVSRGTASPER